VVICPEPVAEETIPLLADVPIPAIAAVATTARTVKSMNLRNIETS
jgi:hypothetical protein